jgi:hypothetical protein
MYDDGAHNDGASGDGVYGISIPVNSSFIQYYIYAENSNAGIFSPVRAEHEFYSLFASIPVITPGDVVINELMAVNTSTISDPQGDFSDWIELYNTTSNFLDLSNLYLSDDILTPLKFVIPSNTIIAPNDYILIWADMDTTDVGLHANFKLSSVGEDVILSYANGTVIDQTTFPAQTDGTTYGRYVNGTGSFTFLLPTPLAENSLLGVEEYNEVNIFKLFPNPSNGNVTISSNDLGIDNIQIFDLTGKMISSETLNLVFNHQMNLNHLSNGVYLVKINQTQTFKLSIQK